MPQPPPFKKVGVINTNEYLTEALKKELRLLFHG